MLFLLVDDSTRVIVLLLVCFVSFYFSNFVRDKEEKRKEGKPFGVVLETFASLSEKFLAVPSNKATVHNILKARLKGGDQLQD
jgi:hypothetical protein